MVCTTYFREFLVSERSVEAGEMFTNISVLPSPVSESSNDIVSLLFLIDEVVPDLLISCKTPPR